MKLAVGLSLGEKWLHSLHSKPNVSHKQLFPHEVHEITRNPFFLITLYVDIDRFQAFSHFKTCKNTTELAVRR